MKRKKNRFEIVRDKKEDIDIKKITRTKEQIRRATRLHNGGIGNWTPFDIYDSIDIYLD